MVICQIENLVVPYFHDILSQVDYAIERIKMRFITALIVLFVLSFTVKPLYAEQWDFSELAENAEEFFDVSFGDLQEELELVTEENKKALLVMFETEECPWCLRMKNQVLNRVAIQDYFKDQFRILSLDAEGDVEVVDFDGNLISSKDFALKNLRVRATPVFVFF